MHRFAAYFQQVGLDIVLMHLIYMAVFDCVSKAILNWFVSTSTSLRDWFNKNLRHPLNQSDTKVKAIVTCSLSFSRA